MNVAIWQRHHQRSHEATCPTDFNASDTISVQDIFDFLAAYFAGCS